MPDVRVSCRPVNTVLKCNKSEHFSPGEPGDGDFFFWSRSPNPDEMPRPTERAETRVTLFGATNFFVSMLGSPLLRWHVQPTLLIECVCS